MITKNKQQESFYPFQVKKKVSLDRNFAGVAALESSRLTGVAINQTADNNVIKPNIGKQ